MRNAGRLWHSSPLSPLPHQLEDALVQMGNWSQNSTVKERKCSQSRWAPTCSPEECADYLGIGPWQSLNRITKQWEMIKPVTRVTANLFKKVARPKRRMWGLGGPAHSWSWFSRPPGQQSQVNMARDSPFYMPFQCPQVNSLDQVWWGVGDLNELGPVGAVMFSLFYSANLYWVPILCQALG